MKLCSKTKQCERDHFDILNSEKDSKLFWISFKPYFSNKHSFGDWKVALSENIELLTKTNMIANTFNSFFETVTDSLILNNLHNLMLVMIWFQVILLNFSNHPSILKIKEKFQLNKIFSF